ncbi:MAG: hypothetical protein Q8P84_08020 [Deltaproteobacteria bacterium]|nr:hypothetical protein [Deltaproteobacteria bacterium]
MNITPSFTATAAPFIYDRVSTGSVVSYWHELNGVDWGERPVMSDGSMPPPFGLAPPKMLPWHYFTQFIPLGYFRPWLKESPPRTRVLSLGEGSGKFILDLLLRRRKKLHDHPLSFEQAPYMAVDAAYGFLQGAQLVFPSAHTWSDPHAHFLPDFHLMEWMRSQFPGHYYYSTFQNLDIRDASDRPIEFDEVVARHSLGYVLREAWDRDGFQEMRQILDRNFLHLRSGGRMRMNGFIKDNEPPLSLDELFFDDLETLLRMYIAQGILKAYNTNFRQMPYHFLLLVKN